MADLQKLKERLVPIEVAQEFDDRFANAFLVLYFSASQTFVLTHVKEVLGSDIIAESRDIRHILNRRNLANAYDLRITCELLREKGFEFFTRHPNLENPDLRQIADAIKTDDPVIMLEFETQGMIETLFRRGDKWFKMWEFRNSLQ